MGSHYFYSLKNASTRLLPLLAATMALLAMLTLPDVAHAQAVTLDFGSEDGVFTSRIVQMIALITVLSLAPGILVMVTSFTRLIIVFSFLRTAIGLQQTPPNIVLISLSLFLTFFIMQPVFEESYENGIRPLMQNELAEEDAFGPISQPFHKFMIVHTREKDLGMFLSMANLAEEVKNETDVPFRVLIPSFMLSELRRAFEIGFLLFIPFLVIDMVVASTLMAMGMMMLPPVLISLPFKVIFFVLIDGWYLVVGSLVRSYGG